MKPGIEILEERDVPSGFTPPVDAVIVHHEAVPAQTDEWALQAQHQVVITASAQPPYDEAVWQESGHMMSARSDDGDQTWSDPLPAKNIQAFTTVLDKTSAQAGDTVKADVYVTQTGPSVGGNVLLHFDSTELSLVSVDNVLADGLVGVQRRGSDEILAAWADVNSSWGGETSVHLFTATFLVLDGFVGANLDYLPASPPPNWSVIASSVSVSPSLQMKAAVVHSVVPLPFGVNPADLVAFFEHQSKHG